VAIGVEFKSLSISKELLAVLAEQKFTEATPIQAQSIPALLEGQDLLGQSQTGSGKTLAFALPILQKLEINLKLPQALILCPTRELCDQIVREIRRFGKLHSGLQIVALVGGQPHAPQRQALRQGVHIVVGTPGRILDFLSTDEIQLRELKTLVLDEADRMLDEGFTNEMDQIRQLLPVQRQTALFSATFSENIKILSQKFQKNPVQVSIAEGPETALSIEQFVYIAENPQKLETLLRILQQHPSQCTLIFCRTKASVSEILLEFQKLKVSCAALHGDMEQSARDQVMALFRNGSLRILIATDVAARGLDIDHLELVINYDLPSTAEVYVHRVGRTGRAGKNGLAVSIANGFEAIKLMEIEKLTKIPMTRKTLGFKNQLGLSREFQTASMKTLFIAGGRKDKLRPGDLLGTLTAAPQALAASDIGKIELHDHHAFVAVKNVLAEIALDKLRRGKIKGSKFKTYLL
jgi:ATP-independent RNA helicase DbpA